MTTRNRWNWLASLTLVGLVTAAAAGCGYNPYPTPKPIVTPGIDAPLVVQRATYETSTTADIPPTAVPVLHVQPPATSVIRPFAEWTEQEVAADALGRIGPPAIPYLQQSLRSNDVATKIQAAEVLARMGSDAKPAVNDLVALLDDPNPEVRKVATRTLGRIGPDSAPAIPALMRSLVQPELAPPPASATFPAATEPRLLPGK